MFPFVQDHEPLVMPFHEQILNVTASPNQSPNQSPNRDDTTTAEASADTARGAAGGGGGMAGPSEMDAMLLRQPGIDRVYGDGKDVSNVGPKI